ncbi:hypothetical protein Hanom_Chr03g00183161 [Helianthus anomalus]
MMVELVVVAGSGGVVVVRRWHDGARVEFLMSGIMWVGVCGVKGLCSGCGGGILGWDPYAAENHQLRCGGAGGLWGWTWSSCMKSIFL